MEIMAGSLRKGKSKLRIICGESRAYSPQLGLRPRNETAINEKRLNSNPEPVTFNRVAGAKGFAITPAEKHIFGGLGKGPLRGCQCLIRDRSGTAQ